MYNNCYFLYGNSEWKHLAKLSFKPTRTKPLTTEVQMKSVADDSLFLLLLFFRETKA